MTCIVNATEDERGEDLDPSSPMLLDEFTLEDIGEDDFIRMYYEFDDDGKIRFLRAVLVKGGVDIEQRRD